jgi:hypothetical protein
MPGQRQAFFIFASLEHEKIVNRWRSIRGLLFITVADHHATAIRQTNIEQQHSEPLLGNRLQRRQTASEAGGGKAGIGQDLVEHLQERLIIDDDDPQ